MFRSKIALKLSLHFAVALLVFSLVMGGVFASLFRNYTLNLHKIEMEGRANTIAAALSSTSKMGGAMSGPGGYGSYMRFMGDIAGTDVWVIDKELNLLTGGKGQGGMSPKYAYKELPPNAEEIIKEVFGDKSVFSQEFSNLLSQPTLTVGVPIKSSQGQVMGVVLLHSPVHGTQESILQGITILGISILSALAISILLSIFFSYLFTKPLSIMKNVALALAEGDYTAKTNIQKDDEIGQLADTLDVLAEQLYLAREQRGKLDQMRKDFVANISHELRTPVTVIRGSLEALTDKVITDPAKVEAYHGQMLDEVKFLQRLVGDLLDLSRLQNMDFAMETSEISMCQVLEDAVKSGSQLAAKKGIVVRVSKSQEVCAIIGDYGRVRQMLMILLDNAIKFSPEGSSIDIRLTQKQLSIEDQGPGISEEDLPYIFDRFYKSRKEENKSGSGLGLAIAKQIADRHGMKLAAENSFSGGKFVLTF